MIFNGDNPVLRNPQSKKMCEKMKKEFEANNAKLKVNISYTIKKIT